MKKMKLSLSPGDTLLLSSDGLAEAHNSKREMFGVPRIKDLMAGFLGESIPDGTFDGRV